MFDKIVFLISLLMLSSCLANGVVWSENPSHSKPTASPGISETPSASPSLPVEPTPAPNDVDPPISEMFFKLTPETLCVGDTLDLEGRLTETDTISIFLERPNPKESMLPPLANEYILLKKLTVEAHKTFQDSLKMNENMIAIDGKTMRMKPGRYVSYLQTLDRTIYGAGSFQVNTCK